MGMIMGREWEQISHSRTPPHLASRAEQRTAAIGRSLAC